MISSGLGFMVKKAERSVFFQAATSKCCILSDETARAGLSQPLGDVRHMLGGRSRACAGQHQT